MILDATTKSLQAKLTSAITTNPVSVTVDYMELPGSNQANVATLISVNTAVNILTAPASGVQRVVNTITAFNDDTATTVITFSVLDGATTSKDYKVTLAAGEQMIYTSINGWKFYDATGKESTASSISITLTGDVTGTGSGTIATTLANIPNDAPMAGDLLATAIAAPSTPAAGKGRIYVDSTSKNLAVKDDAGVVKHGVQTQAAVANSFLTAISDAGAVTVAQPAFSNLSGQATAAQLPNSGVFTGDATTTFPALTISNNAITDAKIRQGAARTVIGVTGNATANVADIQGATDQVLRVNGAGTALAFGAIDLSKVAAATGILQAASFPALTGDVTTVAGALAATLANIPSGVPMAGSLLATAIAAPGTPAAGKGSIYVDSTSKNISVKDDAGVVKHGVQTKTAVASNFLTSISDAGLVTAAQPAFTDITGAITDAQHGARSGGAALHPDATTTVTGFMSTTDKKRMAQTYDAVADFGFVGDLITVFDGAMTTGGSSTTLTCATSTPFTSTLVDGGKRITVRGAGAGGAQLTTTIASVSSSSVAILTVGCSTTVTVAGTSFGTDNTTAISNMTTMINTTNAAFPGAKIVFGKSATNAYGFPTTVLFNKTVEIEGIGGGWNTDNGDYTRIGGTRLAWWGTSSDGGTDFAAFFTFQPAGGASQALKTPAMRNLWLDGRNGDQNAGLYGVRFAGCHQPLLDNVFGMDFRAAAWLCNATAVTLTPTADRGVLRPAFRNINVRSLETFAGAITTPITTSTVITLSNTGQNITVSAATMPVDASSTSYAWVATQEGVPCLVKYTGGGTTTLNVKCSVEDAVHSYATVSGGNVVSAAPVNAACLTFGGDTTANTNCGVIDLSQNSCGTLWGPAAIDIRNADSNRFSSVYVNGGNATNDGATNRIRKPGVRIAGSATATLAGRNNMFFGGSAGTGGINIMGLTAASVRLVAQASANYWDLYELGNGEGLPVVESNAYFDWNPNGGMRHGTRGTVLIADQAISAATLTLLTGSLMAVTPQGFQIGTTWRWTIHLTSGAAGTAAGNIFTIRIGTAGTSADAAVATFTTLGLGTAVVSEVVAYLTLTVRTLGAAASVYASCNISNAGAAGAAVGFIPFNQQTLVPTLATFNSTTVQQFVNVSLTTSTAKTATSHEVFAECANPSNP